MGYPIDLFIDEDISDGFMCAICRDVMKEPVVMNPCEHTYCRSCAEQWRLNKKTCPTDRQRVTKVKNAQRNFISVLNDLTMRCPFSEAGCTTIFKLGDFTNHDDRCRFNPENQKECAQGCGAVLTQAQIKAETHTCIGYLKQQLEDKDRLVQAKEAALNTTVGELTCSQEQIRRLGQKVEEQNSQLESLQVELKANETTLGEKEAQLKTKDAQFTSFRDRVKEMEHHMTICQWNLWNDRDTSDPPVTGKLNEAVTPSSCTYGGPKVVDSPTTSAAAMASSSRGHRKRKLDIEDKSEWQTVPPASNASGIAISDVTWTDSKNIGRELFLPIAAVVVAELEKWARAENRCRSPVNIEEGIESVLNGQGLPFGNVRGLHEGGEWRTCVWRTHKNLDKATSINAVRATTQVTVHVRGWDILVYKLESVPVVNSS